MKKSIVPNLLLAPDEVLKKKPQLVTAALSVERKFRLSLARTPSSYLYK